MQHASIVDDMTRVLAINECLIPGPLVPFFEALAAVNGPFDWIGDVSTVLSDFSDFWNADHFTLRPDYQVRIPSPVVLLDQLAHFAQWQIPANQTVYANFEWYRQIFRVASSANAGRLRNHLLSPPAVGSLYSTDTQVTAARAFWSSNLQTFARVNAAAGQPGLTNMAQFLGLTSQAGIAQYTWFPQVVAVMQKYCHYFNGSRPLKLISPTGLGAIEILAVPSANGQTRNWLYPEHLPSPFLSSAFPPPHGLPLEMRLTFQHADHELEEIAEQYAIITAPNISWARNNAAQHNRAALNDNNVRIGDFWNMMAHRQMYLANLLQQYGQLIASRYHQVTANKAT